MTKLITIDTLKKLNYDKIITRLNNSLTQYIRDSNDEFFNSTLLKSKDVINNILYNFNMSIPLDTLFKEVKGLEYYSGAISDINRFYNSYNGRFCFLFYTLSKKETAKNPRNSGRKGKQIPGLEDYNISYSSVYIGGCTNSQNKQFATLSNIKNCKPHEIFIRFGMTKLLCTQAKYYLALKCSYDRDSCLSRNPAGSIKDFFPFSLYLHETCNRDLYSKLSEYEQDVYVRLLKFRYEILVTTIEEICNNIYSTLNYYNHSKINLLNSGNNRNNIEVNNDPEDYEVLLRKAKRTSYSYGLPFVVQEVLKKTKLHTVLNNILKDKQALDTIVDHIVAQLYESLLEKRTISISNVSPFQLSTSNQVQRRYNEFTKYLSSLNIDIRGTHQILSRIMFSEARKSNSKIMLLLDSTLIKSLAANITKNKDTFSKLDGFIKAFKLILLQTEDGIPIYYDLSDSSVKDVNDFCSLLFKLQQLKISPSQVEICADAGFFSEENQVCAESLGYKYYLMGRSINIIKDSILEQSVEDRLLNFNDQYSINIMTKGIKFKDYINPNKAYVSRLESQIAKLQPDYKISNINKRDILLVNIFNPSKFGNDWNNLASEVTKYYKSIKYITEETKELPKASNKIYGMFYFDKESSRYKLNKEKAIEYIKLLSVATIVSNDISDPTGLKVISIYKKRMSIESSFRSFKSLSGIAPFRNHKDETAEYKCFISWLTLVVYSYIKTKYNNPISTKGLTTKDLEDLSYNPNYMDKVDYALATLHKELTMSINEYDTHNIEYDDKFSRVLKNVMMRLELPDPIDYETGFTFVETCSKYSSINY